jgi:hypothetical protein
LQIGNGKPKQATSSLVISFGGFELAPDQQSIN